MISRSLLRMLERTTRSEASREDSMHARACLTLVTLIAYSGSPSYGASISGTVKGPDGGALNGVFVQAQNKKTHITYMVLSADQGYYRIENCPPETTLYRPRSRAFAATRSRA